MCGPGGTGTDGGPTPGRDDGGTTGDPSKPGDPPEGPVEAGGPLTPPSGTPDPRNPAAPAGGSDAVTTTTSGCSATPGVHGGNAGLGATLVGLAGLGLALVRRKRRVGVTLPL